MRSGCAALCPSGERGRRDRGGSQSPTGEHYQGSRRAPRPPPEPLEPTRGRGLYLCFLLQVVVQDLRVLLLVRRQDVHEGGLGVAGGGRRVDGAPTAQGRGQAEGGGGRAGVETLLVERLLGNGNRDADELKLI